jgi:hypothetical protein
LRRVEAAQLSAEGFRDAWAGDEHLEWWIGVLGEFTYDRQCTTSDLKGAHGGLLQRQVLCAASAFVRRNFTRAVCLHSGSKTVAKGWNLSISN